MYLTIYKNLNIITAIFTVLNHVVSVLQLYSCSKIGSAIPDPLYFHINVRISLDIAYKKTSEIKIVLIMSIKYFKVFNVSEF